MGSFGEVHNFMSIDDARWLTGVSPATVSVEIRQILDAILAVEGDKQPKLQSGWSYDSSTETLQVRLAHLKEVKQFLDRAKSSGEFEVAEIRETGASMLLIKLR